jgi:hypothetical protein
MRATPLPRSLVIEDRLAVAIDDRHVDNDARRRRARDLWLLCERARDSNEQK